MSGKPAWTTKGGPVSKHQTIKNITWTAPPHPGNTGTQGQLRNRGAAACPSRLANLPICVVQLPVWDMPALTGERKCSQHPGGLEKPGWMGEVGSETTWKLLQASIWEPPPSASLSLRLRHDPELGSDCYYHDYRWRP